jgi:hypothetical protein
VAPIDEESNEATNEQMNFTPNIIENEDSDAEAADILRGQTLGQLHSEGQRQQNLSFSHFQQPNLDSGRQPPVFEYQLSELRSGAQDQSRITSSQLYGRSSFMEEELKEGDAGINSSASAIINKKRPRILGSTVNKEGAVISRISTSDLRPYFSSKEDIYKVMTVAGKISHLNI